MKKIQLKMKALECSQDSSFDKSMGIFPDAQGQLTLQSVVGSGQFSNSSETLRLSLLPAKMKKIRSKMTSGARVFTTLYINFSEAQGRITLESVVVSGRNFKSSKLSCISLLPAIMRMIESKMKELECSQDFSNYKSMGIFPDAQAKSRAANSAVLGPIWLNFELVRDVMDVLDTYKYEEDLIKNEGARVFTTFPHYIPMGTIGCHGN